MRICIILQLFLSIFHDAQCLIMKRPRYIFPLNGSHLFIQPSDGFFYKRDAEYLYCSLNYREREDKSENKVARCVLQTNEHRDELLWEVSQMSIGWPAVKGTLTKLYVYQIMPIIESDSNYASAHKTLQFVDRKPNFSVCANFSE